MGLFKKKIDYFFIITGTIEHVIAEMRYSYLQIEKYICLLYTSLDVPALRGGKPIIVESEPDWYVKQVMEDFVVRAERISCLLYTSRCV